MTTTARFGFQLLSETQSSKSVTVNENAVTLDALLMLSAVSSALTAPPASPADQACYIVAAGGTGAWSSRDGQVAKYEEQNASWTFFTPATGWLCYDQGGSSILAYTGSVWVIFAPVPATSNLTDIDGLSHVSGGIIVSNGANFVLETPVDAVGPMAAAMAHIYGG